MYTVVFKDKNFPYLSLKHIHVWFGLTILIFVAERFRDKEVVVVFRDEKFPYLHVTYTTCILVPTVLHYVNPLLK